MFECRYSGVFSHAWIVNGVQSLNEEFPSQIGVTGGSSGNPSVLTIPATSQFNNSVVQCLALSLSGGAFSRNATLIIRKLGIVVIKCDRA